MMKLEDLKVYNVAKEIGELSWNIIVKWDFFNRETLGKQFVRAADSISFNISEGFGRFHYAENRNFCFYSRGSAYETKTALDKALARNLISKEEFQNLNNKLSLYFLLINSYIKSIGKAKDLKES